MAPRFVWDEYNSAMRPWHFHWDAYCKSHPLSLAPIIIRMVSGPTRLELLAEGLFATFKRGEPKP